MLAPMPGRIAFIVSDAARFASSFLPLVRAGRELGHAVDVLAPGSGAAGEIGAAGARLLPVQACLDSINPMRAGYAAGQIAAILKASKPDLVHCLGLGPALLGGAACAMTKLDRRVYSLGSLDDLPLGGLLGRMARGAVRSALTGPLRTRTTRYAIETERDRDLLGIAHHDATILPTSGIDPEQLRPLPMPPSPPLKVALVAPMIRANGIDTAVEAIRLARARGIDVELSLFDVPHGRSSGALAPETLASWGAEPGMSWRGSASDPAELWAGQHVACLPSRSGEGVRQELLEAAACGRPLVTSEEPGGRLFVTDGSEGFVVPSDDPAALADAFGRLAADPVLLPRMGAAARARVLHGYTERDVTDAAKILYAELLGQAGLA
jgi:glycosyltransferase involved in cell wall biosynthesis